METRWQRKLVLIGLLVWVVVIFAAVGWLALRPVTPTERRAGSGAGESTSTRDVASAAAASGQVNVVIFLIDTLRADRVGAYGYGKPTTPHMDALASEGVVFEQCGAAAPWTLPSVVSLLTSTFPCEHRVLVDGQRIDGSLEPLAARLHRSGYATASFLANAYAGPVSGLNRGYDVCQRVGFTDGEALDAWLDTVPAGRPVHAYIHNIEPHNPYNAPDRLVGYFGQVPAGVKQTVMQAYLGYRSLTRVDYAAKQPPGTTDNTDQQARALRRLDDLKADIDVLYDAAVRLADERLGSVIEVLRRRDLWDDTLFIVTSDHGEELGDHGGWQHDQSVYDELMHVPLIVRFPKGVHGGRRVSAVVSLVDVMPTILEVVGRPDLGGGCRGRSLIPLPEGGTSDTQVTGMRINRKKYYRPYKETRGDINVVVRRGDLKGIWNVEPGTFELYDLGLDPLERSNVSGQRGELADSLRRFAEAWLASCGAGGQDRPAAAPGELDEETLDNLRSLGYVE